MIKNKLKAAFGLAGLAGIIVSSGAYASTSLNYNGSGVITSTDTITVNGVGNSGDLFKVCKIVDIKYDSTADSITYAFTTNFQNYVSNISDTNSPLYHLTIEDYQALQNGTASGSTITGSNQIDQIAAAIASGYDQDCTNMTTSGTSATVTVPFGAYIVKPVRRNDAVMSKVYGAMIANINVKESNGEYIEDPDSVKTLVAKASNAGTIAKTVKKDGGSVDTFEIGEVFQYEVTATIPLYPSNATNTTFAVTDTMESGLTFDSYGTIAVDTNTTYTVDTSDTSCNSNICIKNGNNKVGEVRVNGNTRTFLFYNALDVQNSVKIVYSASLNTDATLGDRTGADNNQENSAKLKIPKNVYSTSEEWEESQPAIVPVYTYGLRVIKQDASTNTGLSGAEFDLCRVNQNPCPAASVITHITMSNSQYDMPKSTASLAAGTYYLVETKAPTGYVLPRNAAAITTVTVTKGQQTTDPYSVIVTIPNTKTNFRLPFTGGRGVIIYAIAGTLIVAGASVFYVRKKKQQKA